MARPTNIMLENKRLRAEHKAKRKLEMEAQDGVQPEEKKVAPSVLVTKTEQDPDVKRIQVQQLHRPPTSSARLDNPPEQAKTPAGEEIPSCVKNGCLHCPRCQYKDLEETEQADLMRCPICGTISRIPETDRAEIPVVESLGPYTFMVR